jgi:hypothetical protein
MLINKIYPSLLSNNNIIEKSKAVKSLLQLCEKPNTHYYKSYSFSIPKSYNYNISFGASAKTTINNNFKNKKLEVFKNTHTLNNFDASACLVLNLDNAEIQKYKELKTKYPLLNPMELGLVSKFQLTDKDINKYLKITTEIDEQSGKKYNFAKEELILCLKEGFDDNQIERYFELRNRELDLRNETVRGIGGKQRYPVNFVINAVRQNKTDEDINEEEELLKLVKKYGIGHGILKFMYGAEFDSDKYIQECRKNAQNGSIEHAFSLIGINQFFAGEDGILSQESLNIEKKDPYDAFINFYQKLNETVPNQYASDTLNLLREGKENNFPIEDTFKMMYLPKKYRKKIFNKESSINQVYAKFLPKAIRDFYINGQQGKYYQRKKEICDIFVVQRLFAASIDSETNGLLNEDILTEEQLKDSFKLIEQGCNSEQARILTQIMSVSSITPDILEQIPENMWYIMQTGTGKETHDVIQNAIKLMMEFSEDLPQLTKIEADEIDDILSQDYFYDGENLKSQKNNFSLNLQKLMVYDKPVLIINDNNSVTSFVSFDGAIARIAPPVICNYEELQKDMKPHCNLAPEKQAPVLARAIKEFVFNITDENGNCIISNGIKNIAEPVILSDKTDDETKKYYLDLLKKLKDDNKFNAGNILKIFPKDSVLSINPYTTKNGGNMLYSISAEWRSKNDTRWQMRIHSTDLSTENANSDWDIRLGYELTNSAPNQQKTFYLRYDKDKGIFDFNGTYKGKDSHIKINSPVDDGSLLNNTEFQKVIRNISSKLYETKKVDNICKKYSLPVNIGYRNTSEKINAVIEDAMKNPFHYYEYEEDIDNYRKSFGLLNLKKSNY